MAARVPRRSTSSLVALVMGLAVVLTPSVARPLPGVPEVERIAFLARGDNPVDALAASSVAGMLGGVVILTPTAQLHPAASRSLEAFDPDLVVIAGDEVAVSAATEAAVNALGYPTRRAGGDTRYETAELLADLVDEFGSGRPVLTSADPGAPVSVAGDAYVEGAVIADNLETFGALSVHGDIRLDGDLTYTLPATRFLSVPAEAFRPDADGNFRVSGGATGVAGNIPMSAPLYLPHGARLEEVEAHLDDTSASNLQVTLWRFDYAANLYQIVGRVTSAGAAGRHSLPVGVAAVVIDNTKYGYVLTAAPVGGWDGGALVMLGATVEVSVVTP